MLTYLPTTRLQSFDNTGKILNGGKVYFYALGTTTPKETYIDINGNANNSNPVSLDSVGVASIYLNGSYTLVVTDKYDVPLGPPVDILGGINDYITGAGGNFADNIVISVNKYADIRALNNPYAWVFCQGREYQADGGEGLFYLDQSNATSDDDGIILSPQVPGKYVRYNFSTIDPRWYGLVYDTAISQAVYLDKAALASDRFNVPVLISGQVYINSNYSTSGHNSSWIFNDYSSVVSTLSVDFIFTSNVRLISCGKNVWSNFVQPIFSSNVTDKIKYSWMNASNVEGKVSKFLAASTNEYIVEIDENISTSEDFIAPTNYVFSFNTTNTNGLIYFNSLIPQNLTLYGITDSSIKNNIVKYRSFSTIGNISLSFTITPAFFCADGTGLLDDSTAIQASFKAGSVILDQKYLIIDNIITVPNVLSLYGPSRLLVKEKITDLSNIPFQSILFAKDFNVTGTIFENINLIFTSAATFNGIDTLNSWTNIFLQLDGTGLAGLFGSNSYISIKDSKIISDRKFYTSNGSSYGQTILENFEYISNSNLASTPFTVMTSVINSSFDTLSMLDSANIEGVFGSMTNTKILPTYGSNIFNISGTTINNLTFYDNTVGTNFASIRILGGINIINDSQFYTDDYKQLSYGVGGVITFNNCYFSDKITKSDKSNVVYKFNNCVGGIKESNGIINNVVNDTFDLSASGILTSALGDFISVSGSNAIFSNSNITLNLNYLNFSTSGWYDYIIQPLSAYTGVNTSSTSGMTNLALVKVCESNNDSLIKFKTFGGKISISVFNPGKSKFKVCFLQPDYYADLYSGIPYGFNPVVASAGSLIVDGNYKMISETPYLNFSDAVDTLTTEYNFWNGFKSFSPTFMPILPYFSRSTKLTDKFGIRNESPINHTSSNFRQNNLDMCFVGFIDAGTKIKVTITPEIPYTNEVYNNFFYSTSANKNTYYTLNSSYYGIDYTSSGANDVSNKWITDSKFEKNAYGVSVKGISPTPFIESRTDVFLYQIRNGINDVDEENWIGEIWNKSFEISNSATMVPGVNIELEPIIYSSSYTTPIINSYLKTYIGTNWITTKIAYT